MIFGSTTRLFIRMLKEPPTIMPTRLLCCLTSNNYHHNTGEVDTDNMPHHLKSYGTESSCPKLANGVLRLYSMRFSPYAQRTRLVLEHKKIPYETVNVKLYYGKKPNWLLKKNPFGLVPILEKDDQIIYESTAICEWLDDMYPDNPPKLMSEDPCQKAKDRALLENFEILAERLRRMLFLPEPKPEPCGGPFELPTTVRYLSFKPEVKETAIPLLQENLKYYENALEERGDIFFGGIEPSLLDFYLWPYMERVPVVLWYFQLELKDLINKGDYPKTKAWYDAMIKLPTVKATMLDKGAHSNFIESLAVGNPDYDCGVVEEISYSALL